MKEFGSEFHISYGQDSYFTNIAALKAHHAFVRTGREALLLTTRHEELANKVVLMPAYCCWSMEAPFIQAGYDIEYYQLNDDLTINIEYLISITRKNNPSLILVMNYFGFTPTNTAVDAIKTESSSIRIVEDFSHCLFSLMDIYNPKVDYYVASIRKSIGLPDGGICISDFELSNIEDDKLSLFVNIRNKAEILKFNYQYTASEADKSNFMAGLSEAAKMLKEQSRIIPTRISNEAMAILNHTLTDSARRARMCNYEHLYELIKDNANISIPFNISMEHTAPFALPILVENRNDVQRRLANRCIYAPVLWPITDKAAGICKNAEKFSSKMLAIPIDQRYDYYDIEEIGQRINEII